MNRKLISNRFNYNAGILSWYVKELTNLTEAMTKATLKEITKIYKAGGDIDITLDESVSSQMRIALNELKKKYGDKFSSKAKILIESLLKKTNRYANWQFNKQLKDMLGDKAKGFSLSGSAISPEKSEIMKAILFENTSLIKSIPEEYFKDITGAVARSIENGRGLKYLTETIGDMPFLEKYAKNAKRRAELIAQDQTRKAYSSINLRNFQEAGIKKFKWLHSGGSRDPRLYHKNVLDGQIFDIDKPPVIDLRTNEKGYPGQLPNCGCVMCAVLDFDNQTYDEWKENKHPRDKGGKFTENGAYGKITKKDRKALELQKDEYSKVMHELNTNLTKAERKKRQVIKHIGNYKYTVINNGFNEYKIIKKERIL